MGNTPKHRDASNMEHDELRSPEELNLADRELKARLGLPETASSEEVWEKINKSTNKIPIEQPNNTVLVNRALLNQTIEETLHSNVFGIRPEKPRNRYWNHRDKQ